MKTIAEMFGDDGPRPFSAEKAREWGEALRRALALHREKYPHEPARSPFSEEWHQQPKAAPPTPGEYDPPPWRRKDW